MKSFLGFLLFLLVFAAAGVVMHFFIYSKPGVFIWSLDENRKIVQSKLKADGPQLVKPAGEKSEPVHEEEAEVSDVPLITEVVVAENKDGENNKPEAPREPKVVSLFNGKDLGKWEITQYGGEGEVFVTENGELEFGFGAILTGVHWKEEPPRTSNYEIALEAMKLDGTDFFCALTFPVKDSHATFVVGGWGGGVVGISSIDDLDASENETMTIEGFNENVWHRIRVKVTDEKIETWIDDDKKVDLKLEDKKISLRPGDIELSVPIGLASFQTRAKFRNLNWKNLGVAE